MACQHEPAERTAVRTARQRARVEELPSRAWLGWNGYPTGPALQGALETAKAWSAAHPTHKVVVALATDGEPSDCGPLDVDLIAGVAADGASGTPKVPTFVIGVGRVAVQPPRILSAELLQRI